MKILRHSLRLGAAVLLVLALADRAPSQSLTISNFSFENATGYGAQSASPSSWGDVLATPGSGCNGNVVLGSGFSGYLGNNILRLNLDPSEPLYDTGTSWVSSVSLGTYQSNSLYTLTVSIAADQGNEQQSAIIALAAGGFSGGATTPSNTVAFTVVNRTNLTTAFQDYTVTFSTYMNPDAVGQGIGILLENQAISQPYGRVIAYDNVRLSFTAIPEVSTLALLLFAAPIGLLFRRRHA